MLLPSHFDYNSFHFGYNSFWILSEVVQQVVKKSKKYNDSHFFGVRLAIMLCNRRRALSTWNRKKLGNIFERGARLQVQIYQLKFKEAQLESFVIG